MIHTAESNCQRDSGRQDKATSRGKRKTATTITVTAWNSQPHEPSTAYLRSVKMSERDRAVLYLMLNSGLRISEVTALTIDDLDLVRGRVHVRHGKGDKERYSLFGPTAADCLRVWLVVRNSARPFLFVDKWGRHLTISGVYKIVKRVSGSAGVKVNPHALRHTFGTEFLNAGGLATDLQLLMGHEHIETTLIYAKVALDRIQERFAGLSLIERLAGDK